MIGIRYRCWTYETSVVLGKEVKVSECIEYNK